MKIMKRMFFLIIPAMLFFACNNAQKPAASEKDSCCNKDSVDNSMCKDVMTVDSILANLESYVDKEVSVCGRCSHICNETGKNIFITTFDSSELVLVGKTGEGIETFDKSFVDKDVVIKGILRANKVEGDPEVHHEIEVTYYVEVTKIQECSCKYKCTGEKDASCCGGKSDSKCSGKCDGSKCGGKSDSKCGGTSDSKCGGKSDSKCGGSTEPKCASIKTN
jgi:hypothetical protein